MNLPQDSVSLRTDFDFFELAADRTTEYCKDLQLPPSLREDLPCSVHQDAESLTKLNPDRRTPTDPD